MAEAQKAQSRVCVGCWHSWPCVEIKPSYIHLSSSPPHFRRTSLSLTLFLQVSYNGDEVIEINVSSDPQRTVDISDSSKGKSVEFSYSVKWKKTAITYDHRMDRYSRYSFLPQHLEVSAVGGVVRACTREKGGSIGAMPRCVINSFPFPCLPKHE